MSASQGILAILAANATLLVWNLIAAWRVRVFLRRAAAYDALLAHLCYQAFILQHQPVWRACTAVMGSITIDISQTRNLPGDQT